MLSGQRRLLRLRVGTVNTILVVRGRLLSVLIARFAQPARCQVATGRVGDCCAPTLLELEPEPLGPFPQSLRLAEAGDVTLVPVPGHTPGQIGVLVNQGDETVFLAGDSSYTQDLMLRGKVDGVGSDDDAERLTHERIRAYAAANSTVYLVAHDPDTGVRLAERQLVHPNSVEVAA
jgi:glyoxylase-like metal-dependent hydrolase (beta-lactamase superfamily II)